MENIEIIRSKRKTISLRIKPDGSIELRTPLYMTDSQIQKFINEKTNWIEKHLKSVKERQEQMKQIKPLSNDDIQKLADKALDYIPNRVEYYSKILNVTYGKITIRNQKSRWGSCSSKGNLNFNCLLMLTPTEVLDYVIVHELCHRKEMNHSARFWAEVEKIIPDYKNHKKWLKEHGDELIMRMTM